MKIKLNKLVEQVLQTVIAKHSLNESVNKDFMQTLFNNPRVRIKVVGSKLGLDGYIDKLEAEMRSGLEMAKTGDEKQSDSIFATIAAKLFFLEKGVQEFLKKLFGYQLQVDPATTKDQFSPAMQAKLQQLFLAWLPKNLAAFKDEFLLAFNEANLDDNMQDEFKFGTQDVDKLNYSSIIQEVLGQLTIGVKALASVQSPVILAKVVQQMIAFDDIDHSMQSIRGKANANWQRVIDQFEKPAQAPAQPQTAQNVKQTSPAIPSKQV